MTEHQILVGYVLPLVLVLLASFRVLYIDWKNGYDLTAMRISVYVVLSLIPIMNIPVVCLFLISFVGELWEDTDDYLSNIIWIKGKQDDE